MKKDWELTKEAFDALLARLDADREEAGRKYEAVRRKLIKFLGFWGASYPEEEADQTMSIAARKLLEGEEIENLNGYLLGIARRVYKESVRRSKREREFLRLQEQETTKAEQADDESRRRCYERCLQTLTAQDRDLIASYYRGHRAIDREGLAAKLGTTLNSLRVSVFRIRKRLEKCLETCLAKR